MRKSKKKIKKHRSRHRRKRAFRKLYRKSKKIAKKSKKRKPLKKRRVRRFKKSKRKTSKRKARRLTKRRKISRVRKRPRKRVSKRKVAGKKIRSTGSSLEQLFESPAKVQVMKLFFRNPQENFLVKEVKKRLRINLSAIKKEMKRMEKIGLLRTKQISSRKHLFSINPSFDFFNELRELVLKSSPVSRERMLKAIRGLGKIKLVLLSGLFINNNMSRADLLIVGDNINSRKLNTFIKNIESEAGAEVRCVAMSSEEFNYRYDMYDRFVRDLLSDKHEILINRMGI